MNKRSVAVSEWWRDGGCRPVRPTGSGREGVSARVAEALVVMIAFVALMTGAVALAILVMIIQGRLTW